MSKILHKEWTNIWSEVFSPTIFRLDIIDSFKYRKKQAWLSLLATLIIFSLVSWFFSFDVSNLNWSIDRVVLLAFFYLPFLITLVFWFRACSIYDFTISGTAEKERFLTKKQARAALVFMISKFSFGFYYCYCMYRLWQIGP